MKTMTITTEYIKLQDLLKLANAVETVNGNGDSRLSKKHKDDTERIDPLAACMNALTLALRRRDNPTLADRLQSGTWSM